MFKVGQKVTNKFEGFNGVVVAKTKFNGGTGWFAVLWTLPSGRREQRIEHWSVIK